MVLDKNILVTRVGNEIDYGLAYAFGVLANLSYFPDVNFDDTWGAAFGFTNTFTVTTPAPELPNYTRVLSDGVCVFSIAGTINWLQMFDNLMYCGQVRDLDFGDGWVHSYFRYCARGLVAFIDADLAGRPRSTKLAFTGHSLGGAVAHLLAWYYSLQGWDVRNCVVFNSPRVGSPEFADLSRPFGYWHVRNSHDQVSALPTRLTFELTNGFPIFDQDLNRWEHPKPMFSLSGSGLFGFPLSAAPASRRPAIGAWNENIADFVSGWNYELQRKARRNVSTVRSEVGRVGGAAAALAGMFDACKSHYLDGLLELIRGELLDSDSQVVLEDLIELQTHLTEQPDTFVNPAPYPRDFGLVDPVPFMSPTPPASPATPIPATTPGTVVAATAITGGVMFIPDFDPGPSSLRMAEMIVPPGAPPSPWIDNPRRHWFMRGSDRRMLQALVEAMYAVDSRDSIAAGSDKTSKISTRGMVLDWEDDELVEQWYTVLDQAEYLLGLTYDR